MNKTVQHFRGPKALYNPSSHGHGIYFATDTKEIIADGVSYSGIGEPEFEELQMQVDGNTGALEILNGSGDGSILKMIDDAINDFATKVSSDDVVNTFKELVDYAAEHSSEIVELVGEINEAKQKNAEQDERIEALELLVGGGEEGETSIIEKIESMSENIGQIQIELKTVEEQSDKNASDIVKLQELVGSKSVSEQIDEALSWEEVE